MVNLVSEFSRYLFNKVAWINILNKVENHTVKKGYSHVRCPKCNGNIFFDGSSGSKVGQQDDSTGWCLQCGYIMYSNKDRMLAEQLTSVTTDLSNT